MQLRAVAALVRSDVTEDEAGVQHVVGVGPGQEGVAGLRRLLSGGPPAGVLQGEGPPHARHGRRQPVLSRLLASHGGGRVPRQRLDAGSSPVRPAPVLDPAADEASEGRAEVPVPESVHRGRRQGRCVQQDGGGSGGEADRRGVGDGLVRQQHGPGHVAGHARAHELHDGGHGASAPQTHHAHVPRWGRRDGGLDQRHHPQHGGGDARALGARDAEDVGVAVEHEGERGHDAHEHHEQGVPATPRAARVHPAARESGHEAQVAAPEDGRRGQGGGQRP